jgi:histidinol-phosphate aminotransferase
MSVSAVDKMARSAIRRIRPYRPGKPIQEVEREYGIQNAVKLASNENSLGPSPLAVAAMR